MQQQQQQQPDKVPIGSIFSLFYVICRARGMCITVFIRRGFGVNAFEFTAANGHRTFVRYRFVPRAGPRGRGFYEVEPEASGSDGPKDAADGLGGDPPDHTPPLAGGGDEYR